LLAWLAQNGFAVFSATELDPPSEIAAHENEIEWFAA